MRKEGAKKETHTLTENREGGIRCSQKHLSSDRQPAPIATVAAVNLEQLVVPPNILASAPKLVVAQAPFPVKPTSPGLWQLFAPPQLSLLSKSQFRAYLSNFRGKFESQFDSTSDSYSDSHGSRRDAGEWEKKVTVP